MKNMENLPLSNVSKNEIVTDESTCPSCLMEREAKSTDCQYCGIVFSQYYRWSKEKRTKLTISGLYHLNVTDIENLQTAWQRIEMNYWNQDTHEKFLHTCLRMKSLPFAAYCYTQRLQILPDDDVARLQLEKIVSLSKDWFAPDLEELPSPYNRGLLVVTAALAVMGVIAGVLTLFTGLLTTSRSFYVITGLFMCAAFIGIFLFAKSILRGYR